MINILKMLFPATTREILGEGIITGWGEGYQAAIKDILVFKDKIYTGPVTLPGDLKSFSLKNCTFLGNEAGLKIEQVNK